MEILTIIKSVAGYTVAPIGRQLGYLFSYEQNVEDLSTQIDALKNVKERLQHKVEEAQNNARGIEAYVNDWLAKACKIIIEDHGNFTRDEERANTKSICGANFLNLVLRHRLSTRAKKMAETVATLIQKGENINQVSYRLNLPVPVVNKGYEEFESRSQILTDVMGALRDPSVGMVGVWGMGGVGKTMLAKEVARRAKDEENLFTEVVFTTISRDPNIEKIQQDILGKLGMPIRGEESKDVRAARLRNRLTTQEGKEEKEKKEKEEKEEKKILIIFDDIWDKLDLEDFGISFGQDQKGCKILLTARSRHVLATDTSVDSNFIFHVGNLWEHEAKSLFRKMVGDQVEEHDDLATHIVKECGRLPIAITTVASALKDKKRADWKNALHELRKSNPINIPGMKKEVYNSIKLSYDYLESVEAKHLLLLCSLFPEDAEIEIRVLCDYGFGLNLFEDVNTLEEARNKTDALVTNLKDHSLLLDADSSYDDYEYVKLHDVVRDVVIYVASKLDDRHRMHNIRNAAELKKYFNKEMFKDSTAISLYDIKADQYPQTLKGPELNLLRLVANYYLEDSGKLPHQFFEGLNKLRVLDCQFTYLKPLRATSSFRLFPNLQTLRLTTCSLEDISWMEELKSLKILDLSFNSSIEELPRGIGKLNHLLSLNLEECTSLKVIESNVISSLTCLEELNLKNCFPNWEVEGVATASDGRRNANLIEVKELRCLNDLKLEVADVNSLPKDIVSENLEKYYIRTGCYCGLLFDDKKNTSRTLQLELCPNSALNEHDFGGLLGRSDALCLSGLKISKSLAFEIDRMGFQHLKHLTVEESTEIRCIVSWNIGDMDCPPAAFPRLESLVLKKLMNLESIIHDKLTTEMSFGKLRDPPAAFPNLESLVLENLMNLENIIHEKLTTETSFGKLKVIEVRNCDKLKSLFSLFRQLERIEVENCEMMEEIISHDGDHVEKIMISQLQSLKLLRLPKLVQFIATSKSDETKREGRQSIDEPLFNGQVVFPNLDILHIESLKFQKIWNDDQLPSSRDGFQNLTKIDVSFCNHLKGLIPSYMTASLVHLRNLKVSCCEAMKEIIFIEESAQVTGICVSFPRLKSLQLCFLPDLERFCRGDFSSPKLESLLLNCLSNLERFCGGDFSSPKLKSLRLYDLSNLERFCREDCVDCPSLSELVINNCQKLKVFLTNTKPTTITEKEDKNSTGSVADKQDLSHQKLVFPKLEDLHISSGNIQKIWNDDQLTSSRLSFQSLTQIKMDYCDYLKGLIPSCMTASLVHLRNLNVSSCKAMKEIVFIEESTQEMRTYVSFPRLESLQLSNLPDLERFCGGDFSSPQLESLKLHELPNLERFCGGKCVDCPSLSKLAIKSCQKLKVFITNTMPTTSTEKEDKNSTGLVTHKQYLSHDHKDVVKVEQLSTESSCSEITCQLHPLSSVEEHDEYLVFKTKLLSKLKLWNFPNQQQLPKTFPTVEVLSICEWGIRLKDIATPLMSFQNLKDLTVKDCHGLKSLFSPSTAKGLSQRLTKLCIIGCKSLRQVIANEDDGNINIIFSQLKCLVLDDLSNLTSFYSGHNNVVLQFPLLAELRVNCCPEMKTFCRGNIHCPSLHSITLAKWKRSRRQPWAFMAQSRMHTHSCWKGDINTTIQKLWEDKNIRDSPETEESVENVDNAEEDQVVGP